MVASQRASEELKIAGLPHTVLNAARDKHEAEIVARRPTRPDHGCDQHGHAEPTFISRKMSKLGGLRSS